MVGTLTSSVFTSIYNALTGVTSDSKELIGIVDDHEDRLSKVEKDLSHLNNSIESIKNLVIRTRSASHIMATLQVVIHSQFLSLSALKTHLQGYYALLNGVISPDLVSFDQMERLYADLEKKSDNKNLKLVADHPSDFYSLEAKYISYTNFSTKSLTLVVYFDPPTYSASNLFSLKKVIFLPLTFPGVNNVLEINNGLPIFVGGNVGNTLVQVLPDLKNCRKYKNFYHCKHNGIHLKNTDTCVMSILNKKKDISKLCRFSSLGKSSKLFVEQLDAETFVIFTGKTIEKIIFSCKNPEISNRNRVFETPTKLNSLYKLSLPEKCIADLGSHLLSSVSKVGVNSYTEITFDMFFTKSGNLTESLKNLDKKDLIEGLESINSTGDVVYSFKHIQNKIKLKKLKSRSDLKYQVLSYTSLSCLILIFLAIFYYCWKKEICKKAYKNPQRPHGPTNVSLKILTSQEENDPAHFE